MVRGAADGPAECLAGHSAWLNGPGGHHMLAVLCGRLDECIDELVTRAQAQKLVTGEFRLQIYGFGVST